MAREFVCQKMCFGYKNRRWRVGEKLIVQEGEESLLPTFFVPVELFKQPDQGIIGGPRVDGVLKKIEKITDTAMSPDTKAFLEREKLGVPAEPMEPSGVFESGVSAANPIKRGRRLGSKKK